MSLVYSSFLEKGKKHKTQNTDEIQKKKYIMSGLFVSRLPFASLRPSFFLSKNFLSFRVIFCSIFQLFSYQLIIRCSLLSPFLTLKSLFAKTLIQITFSSSFFHIINSFNSHHGKYVRNDYKLMFFFCFFLVFFPPI